MTKHTFVKMRKINNNGQTIENTHKMQYNYDPKSSITILSFAELIKRYKTK